MTWKLQVDLRERKTLRNKRWYLIMKKGTILIKHNNAKEMGTKQESMKICKVQADRTRKLDKSTI